MSSNLTGNLGLIYPLAFLWFVHIVIQDVILLSENYRGCLMSEYIAPTFLVSTPPLLDPNFNESVVLLFEHNDQGAMGLVINRPTRTTVAEMMGPMVDPNYPYMGDNVFWGGPVGLNMGWYVFDGEDHSGRSLSLGQGLRISGSLELARDLPGLCKEKPPIFYMGYAGWGPYQLDREIEEGAWLTVDIDRRLFFDIEPESRWKFAYNLLGIDPAMWTGITGEG